MEILIIVLCVSAVVAGFVWSRRSRSNATPAKTPIKGGPGKEYDEITDEPRQ